MAISIDIPERGRIELHHAVFDINGTLAIDLLLQPKRLIATLRG